MAQPSQPTNQSSAPLPTNSASPISQVSNDSYVLIVKTGGRSRRFTVHVDREASDLGKIKAAAKGAIVSCEFCLHEQMEGRICLFSTGTQQSAGARRWPGAEHVCVRFRGEPATAFRELASKDIDIKRLCGNPEKAAEFRLLLHNPLAAARTKASREKEVSGYASKVASLSQNPAPLPTRSLAGAMVVLMVEAGFNMSTGREFTNGLGMMAELKKTAAQTPAWQKSMRHPVLFPEALDSGTDLRDAITRSLEVWNETRPKQTRVFLIGRLKLRRRDPVDPANILFRLNGMESDDVHMDRALWDHWGPPTGRMPWFADGAITELLTICRVRVSDGKILASDIAFVPVDRYGMPFPESKFEPKCAKNLRRMRVSFAKCHTPFRIGDRRVWPDFVLTNRHGQTVVIEVDIGGFNRKPEKFTKHVYYQKYDFIVISWDPERDELPRLDWNDFSRMDELF